MAKIYTDEEVTRIGVKGNVKSFRPEFIALLDNLREQFDGKKIIADETESKTMMDSYVGTSADVVGAVKWGISRYLRAKGYPQTTTTHSDIKRVRVGRNENGAPLFRINFINSLDYMN